MKKIIIAASIVGAAAAGVILYLRRKNNPANQIEDAAENANDTMNKHIKNIERKTSPALN